MRIAAKSATRQASSKAVLSPSGRTYGEILALENGVVTSDRDTVKFDSLAAGELAVGGRNGSGVERIHATGENPALTGHTERARDVMEGGGINLERQ